LSNRRHLRPPLSERQSGARAMSPQASDAADVERPLVANDGRGDSGPFYFQHAFAQNNPGNILEFYVNEAKLGTGAFGSAYRVACRQSGVQRAAKAIAVHRVKDPSKFEEEINVARQLDHPNVVRLYETFRDATHIYLVMELCTGGELFDRIMKGAPDAFAERRATPYVRQMLAALSYLHSKNFVHRDVKPENFLLQSPSPESSLKLIDFGMARSFVPGEDMTTKGGTPYYVAPEVLRGRYDERIDVWSVGVITYILLCGYPPFNGKSDREVIKRVKVGSFGFLPEDWQNVSQEAKDYTSWLLTIDRQERPSAQAALSRAWPNRVWNSCVAPTDRGVSHSEAASVETAAVDERGIIDGHDLVTRLQAFHEHARMKRVALTAVARQLPDEAMKSLRHSFQELDRDADGVLSIDEVRSCLEMHGVSLSASLEEALRSADSDGSGSLDFTEFLAATLDQRQCADRGVCRAAFRTFDLDGDGRISPDELERVLASPERPDRSPSKRRVRRMLQEAGSCGGCCIDFEDFYAMVNSSGRSGHCGTHGEGGAERDARAAEEEVEDNDDVPRMLFGGCVEVELDDKMLPVDTAGSVSTTVDSSRSSSAIWEAVSTRSF